MGRIYIFIFVIVVGAFLIHLLMRFSGGVEGAKKRAQAGSSRDQFILGTMYETGTQVTQDTKEACVWYKMAAEQGHIEAQSRMAKLMERSGDYLNAILWAKRAAAQDDMNALTLLGLMSFNGQGVKRDTKAAAELLQRPAEAGDTTAQAALALCHMYDSDRSKANEWARKAYDKLREKAQKGDEYAAYTLAVFYREGCGMAKDMAEAERWYTASADKDYTPAQTSLGLLRAHGIGVKQDYASAFKLLHRAAEKGDAVAQANTGIMLLNGNGTPADPVASATWFRKAAEQGEPEAMFGLGAILADGMTGPPNYAEAYFWLTRAASKGHKKAEAAAAQVLPALQTEEAEKIRAKAQK
ncbi:MAG: hypothetical protein ACAH80_08385 [Alphaproteobacteria bacterium]